MCIDNTLIILRAIPSNAGLYIILVLPDNCQSQLQPSFIFQFCSEKHKDMYRLRKQEAIHQVELIRNITLLTSVELLCGRIQVMYLFPEWLDVKALLYLIILVRLKRYHDSITDLTSNVNNGPLQLNLLQKHMLLLNVTALYSWNKQTLKVHRSFAFCNILQ